MTRSRFAGIQFTITGSRPPRGMAMLTEALKFKVPIAAFNGGMFVESDLSTMIEQLPIPVGVATELHAAAWKRMFDDFLRQWSAQSGKAFVPFDAVHDYHLYLDGKLRIAGARSFLTSCRIQLPEEKIRS